MSIDSARRACEIEILDAGTYRRAEIRGNLGNLRFFNRWLGGNRLIRRGVARLLAEAPATRRRLTLLDVATGSGDIPVALARWLAVRGVQASAAAVDANADVLEEARRYQSSLTGDGRTAPVSLVQADARRLPHSDASIDLVVCSNFLHHLEAAAAVEALREMRRVARLGLVVVDLMRSRASLANVWLLTRLITMNRLTRHDGPLSVRRAFTPEEMRRLAAQAGMPGAVVRRSGPVRMVLTWTA